MGLSGADIQVGIMAEKPSKKASAGFFVAETERDFVKSGKYQDPDDRPLHGSGSHYNLEEVQDIAVIDNYSEQELATMDGDQIENIVARYNKLLENAEQIVKQKSIEKEEEMAMAYDDETNDPKQRMGDLKDSLRTRLGSKKFEQVYDLLWKHRSNPDCEDQDVYDDVRGLIGNNKYLMTLIFQLDGIVWREVLAQIK